MAASRRRASVSQTVYACLPLLIIGAGRAIAGIMIQEGALQNKSSNPYLVTDCNTEKEMCADALWSASTAESWRKLYLDKTTHTKPSDFRSYLKICLGAIHLRLLRAIPDSHPKTSLKLTLQRTMYGYLASERQSNAGERRDSNIPSLVHFLLLESRLDSVLFVIHLSRLAILNVETVYNRSLAITEVHWPLKAPISSRRGFCLKMEEQHY